MKKGFRKYHRILGIIIALPVTMTVVTGMLASMVKEWPINTGISARFLLKIPRGEILNVQAIYPVLNGLGMIGLLVTGLSMSGLFRKRKQPISPD